MLKLVSRPSKNRQFRGSAISGVASITAWTWASDSASSRRRQMPRASNLLGMPLLQIKFLGALLLQRQIEPLFASRYFFLKGAEDLRYVILGIVVVRPVGQVAYQLYGL